MPYIKTVDKTMLFDGDDLQASIKINMIDVECFV